MIYLADINVLFALSIDNHQFNKTAQVWLSECPAFATTPITELGLVRMLLTKTPTRNPFTRDRAMFLLERIRAHPKAHFWEDNVSLADGRAIVQHLQGPKQVTDVHLLNLAIAKGGRLVTFDKGIAAPLPPALRKHILELG